MVAGKKSVSVGGKFSGSGKGWEYGIGLGVGCTTAYEDKAND
jgi:hypothetical protein